MTDLGTLWEGGSSEAHGVNADGSVVVGGATNANGFTRAFRWTAETGMQDLNELLKDVGVNMTGIELYQASGVSADGHFIVGTGHFRGNNAPISFVTTTARQRA